MSYDSAVLGVSIEQKKHENTPKIVRPEIVSPLQLNPPLPPSKSTHDQQTRHRVGRTMRL